jgi:predicted nucleic-acid-binding Zn-ribbon protein
LSKPDKDFTNFTPLELSLIPINELQRIRNKRWANGVKELQQQAEDELKRRDPRTNWACLRCGNNRFHESEMRVSGGFLESWLGWERNKYHAIVCDYCGKTEFYSRLMSGAEDTLGFFGN